MMIACMSMNGVPDRINGIQNIWGQKSLLILTFGHEIYAMLRSFEKLLLRFMNAWCQVLSHPLYLFSSLCMSLYLHLSAPVSRSFSLTHTIQCDNYNFLVFIQRVDRVAKYENYLHTCRTCIKLWTTGIPFTRFSTIGDTKS